MESSGTGDWLSALCEAVERSDTSILIIAHSLGCTLVAYFAETFLAKKVEGAFLISPVDVDLIKQDSELSHLLGSFTSMPKKPLPFKSVVVASSNDPYSTIDKSQSIAKAWEASFINVGEQGNINIASGHGPWPEGRRLLKSFFPTFVP